jgi:sigma-B regulation protein RsbU (phosphoserine phosphatase)
VIERLPPEVAAHLIGLCCERHRAFLVRLDAEGRVREVLGPAGEYLGEAPAEGDSLWERLPELATMAASGARPLFVPSLPLPGGGPAEAHLLRCGEEEWLILLRGEGSSVECALFEERTRELDRLSRELAARNRELEAAQARMTADLEAAARLQQALLPNRLPEIPGVRFAWLLEPCEALAGDTVNIMQLSDQHVAFYAIDVSGHGVPASLLSVSLHRFLSPIEARSSVIQRSVSGLSGYFPVAPAQIGRQLNRWFQASAGSEQYFTMLYALLNVQARQVLYISAGHPPLIRADRQGRCRIIDAPGLPVGLVDEADYEEHALRLDPGDRLFAYSDGMIEAADRQGRMFGKERLLEAVAKAADLPLDEALRALLSAVKQWSDGPLQDDVSLIAFELDGA